MLSRRRPILRRSVALAGLAAVVAGVIVGVGAGPAAAASGTCTKTNTADVAISDFGTVSSPLTISGCSGTGSATATVEVHIKHGYRGDLAVSLQAPSVNIYTLHNHFGGSADDIDQRFTVNLSSEVANGTWELLAYDFASGDTGFIDSWTLYLNTPPATCGFANGTDVAIPDLSTVTSNITVSGCALTPSVMSTVTVHIVHTFRGDLQLTVISPAGQQTQLLVNAGGSQDNVDQVFYANLSSTPLSNGTWTLQVRDTAGGDSGFINSWSLNPGLPTPVTIGCTVANGTDVAIADYSVAIPAASATTVANCDHWGSAASSVEVHIVHPNVGDLTVTLVAPSGNVYPLRDRTGGTADNINQTFTVNLSGEPAITTLTNAIGVWALRVTDTSAANTGYINSWTLRFP
jgi:subtilisin-like proprotein convertase family protein